jgi:signal transduction histidine kinase
VRGAQEGLERRLDETERQLQGSLVVRERLGQDLHDHIIQSIYAVGLKVDDCTRQLRSDPEKARTRLESVAADINTVIRDLRNVILGIEMNVIQPQEFKTALKSLALTLSQDQPSRIRIDVEQGVVDQLTPDQATELIHLAREAVSNSLRHANAQTTTLRLQRHDSRLRFTVEDDGAGFDPEKVRPTGFGLRNMARRAENLGAEFEVRSEAGKGTIIRLDIPRQKQHF